jgi:two-component system, chemotaxis family, response regulator Rcp1
MQHEVPRLVIIEDNPVDVRMIQRALRAHGIQHELTVIADGERALEYVENCREESTPDLVVIDLNLPRQHGLDVLRRLRFAPAFVGSRIVVLTSSASDGDRKRAEMIGVDRYIRKPMQVDEFMAIGGTLGDLLKARHAA